MLGTFPQLDVQGLQDCVADETSRPHTQQHAVQRVLADLPDKSVCDRVVLVDGGELTIPQRPSKQNGVNSAAESLLLVCISTRPECVLHSRVMLRLQPNSRLDLVEWHTGGTSERYTSNCMLHVELEPGSCLRHTRVVCEGDTGQHKGHVAVVQHARSAYQLTDVSVGGAWRRTQVTVDLLEPGAQCRLHGLDVAWGKQASAHDMTVRHSAPSCSSDQLCKGLYADKSRGAFHGLVAVPPGAVETSARQLNRNLLLSPTAHVWTQPQLEIETDAVTCSHGATVSQLNDQTLFYLRSRGVAPDRAAGLLAKGFVTEVVDAVQPDWAKSFTQPRVDRALGKCVR